MFFKEDKNISEHIANLKKIKYKDMNKYETVTDLPTLTGSSTYDPSILSEMNKKIHNKKSKILKIKYFVFR